ncbi:type VII secretion-associated serine protease mycosin [Streptomyces spiramyceticus]|uniref:type VII secretion-associated serine protease mycosin n=1 Tax=Streptomyces spiramyceticus TaxID=299717 RepID=UPI00237B6694|nr:type VII secretion-associated serine protease mycosin [Streptomyces spiramyceticus]
MGVKRVWSAAGAVTLAGALLLTSAPTASADSVRDRQWAMEAFNGEKTWAESQGEGVTVAVIDTGVERTHPDLVGQVLPGKDFTDDGGDANDDADGHGTGMASIIAGHGHGPGNSEGVMGLAPKAKILPVQYWDEYKLSDKRMASAIRYAVDEGASVINLSVKDEDVTEESKTAEAVAYAQEHDVVVVAGTGNEGLPVGYPAKLPGVVAVGAVDKSLAIWRRSNHGVGVTLTAPGVDIVQAAAEVESPNGYGDGTGTSNATAYVSATAALVRAKFPDLTAGQVINRLIKSATFAQHDIKKAPDDEYGYGIIRPLKALTMDIPKGPKEGPLEQAPSDSSSKAGSASAGNDDGSTQAEKKSSSSSLPLVIGGIAAAVVIGGIIFAVLRSRGNRGNGGPGPGGPNGGSYPQGMGYPNQPPYPTAQQPYPTAAPGQSPHNPIPYGQQPPHQGQ